MVVAIQPDNYGQGDASSVLWKQYLLAHDFGVRDVNVYSADILEQLRGCDGFMWRHGHYPSMRQIAHRLLPVVERELNLTVYPDQNTCWHYDDKIAQNYLFESLEIPTPKTWVWFNQNLAYNFTQTVDYPIVLKLWGGAGSSNVLLIKSQHEAKNWIDRLFTTGVHTCADNSIKHWKLGRRRIRSAINLLLRGIVPSSEANNAFWEVHKNYVLFQEFLDGNAFDTRVTVIGDRAFAFRRYNRENDFRASGSGIIDFTPSAIAPEFITLAFDIAKKLKTQSCAMDLLWRGTEPVVGEVSYTYVSKAVKQCPGYWDSQMRWHPKSMWPEEAQVIDYIERIKRRSNHFMEADV